MEYMIFTDESSITASRFSSISAFSFPKKMEDQITASIQAILESSGQTEFKWNRFKDARSSFCAEKIVKYVIENLTMHHLRVDTLVWDMQDARHTLQNCDDVANYERMFFHLLKSAMKKRPKGAIWHIRPDERSGIDWKTCRDCLQAVGDRRSYHKTMFGSFWDDPYYRIVSFEQQDSRHALPIQIADLFSGLAVFSHACYSGYEQWSRKKSQVDDLMLFDLPEEEVTLSKSERYRYPLLSLFDSLCKQHKLGVSLSGNKHLHTYKPSNPLNFWLYQPQSDTDKAPTKNRRPVCT